MKLGTYPRGRQVTQRAAWPQSVLHTATAVEEEGRHVRVWSLAMSVVVAAAVVGGACARAQAQQADPARPESLPRADATRLSVLLAGAEAAIPDAAVFTNILLGRATLERVCRSEPIYACAEAFDDAIAPRLHARVAAALAPVASQLCEEGDALACILHCRYARRERRDDACQQACATGHDPAICYLATQRSSPSRFPELAPLWLATATAACDLGVPSACIDAARPTWVQRLQDPSQHLARYARGCALGNAVACDAVGHTTLADATTRTRALDRACALGSRFACERYCTDADSTADEAIPIGATCDVVVSYICDVTFENAACTTRMSFNRVRIQQPDDEFARAYVAELQAACDVGTDAYACATLSEAYADREITRPNRRAAARYRALARRLERESRTFDCNR